MTIAPSIETTCLDEFDFDRTQAGLLSAQNPAMPLERESFGASVSSLWNDHERYRTVDPQAAEDVITGFLSPHRLTVHGDDQRFAAVGSVAEAGAIALCLMSYGEEVVVDRPAQDDPYVAILVPMSGQLLVRLKDEEFVARPYQTMAAISPGEGFHLRWSKDCRVLTLRADSAALQSAVLALSPQAQDKPVRLNSAKVDGPQRYAILGIAQTLTHVFSNYRHCSELPRPLARLLSEQALSTVLMTLGNNHSDDIFRPLDPAIGRSVRTVMDLVHAEDQAQFTLGDLAAEAGVSVRALELAFRKELNTTPSAYVLRTRLKHAHEELRRADPRDGTTVTDVAMKWGFAHTGRFAGRYRETFGVAPSEVLRNCAD